MNRLNHHQKVGEFLNQVLPFRTPEFPYLPRSIYPPPSCRYFFETISREDYYLVKRIVEWAALCIRQYSLKGLFLLIATIHRVPKSPHCPTCYLRLLDSLLPWNFTIWLHLFYPSPWHAWSSRAYDQYPLIDLFNSSILVPIWFLYSFLIPGPLHFYWVFSTLLPTAFYWFFSAFFIAK